MPDEKVNQVNRRFRLMINNLQVLLIVLINYSSIDHSQGDINIVIKNDNIRIFASYQCSFFI